MGWSTLPTRSNRLASIKPEKQPVPSLQLARKNAVAEPSSDRNRFAANGKLVAKRATIPVPFHKLLKVVAIVDAENPQIKQLLDRITAENFKIEVSDRVDRDVSKDASVGPYIALIDGDRLERARSLARAIRAVGFRTPLWGLADSHRIANLGSFEFLGEVTGYIYLGSRHPATTPSRSSQV